MGYIAGRPPIPGETEEEALKRDIEYYEKHLRFNRRAAAIMFFAVFLLTLTVVLVIGIKSY